jgi:type II secretion system protein N
VSPALEKWKARALKVAPWIGYPIFYVFAFAVFAVATFPLDKVKERIVTSFNSKQRETNGHDELHIGDMTGYWLTGVKMSDVRLLSAAADPTQPPSELKVDEARVRLEILPLLIGNEDLDFHLSAFGGEVSGSYDLKGNNKVVEVELSGIDLSQVTALSGLIGLPIEGTLDGSVKLTMPEGKASKASGTIALEASNVAIGDGKAKLKGLYAPPKVVVGTLSIAGEAKDGTLKITKLAAGGKDIELQGDGRISMREQAMESLVDLSLRFKINDGYRNKNDVTKMLFGSPGSPIPPVIESLDPRVKASKRTDGFYGWQLRGPLGRLEPAPQGGGVAAPIGPGTPGGIPGAGPMPGVNPPRAPPPPP